MSATKERIQRRVRLSRDQRHTSGGYLVPPAGEVKTGEPKVFQHRAMPVVLDCEGPGQGQTFDLSAMTKQNVKQAMQRTTDPLQLLSMFRTEAPPRQGGYQEYTVEELQNRGLEVQGGVLSDGDVYYTPATDGNGAPVAPPAAQKQAVQQQFPGASVETLGRGVQRTTVALGGDSPRPLPANGQAASVQSFAPQPTQHQTPVAPVPVDSLPAEGPPAPSLSSQAEVQGMLQPATEPSGPPQPPASSILQDLGIEFLSRSGGEASKPTKTVIFDFGKLGQFKTRYHEVVYQDLKNLVLIYDVRYDEGNQYLPPASKEPIRVLVPGLGLNFPQVFSVDVRFTLGTLDFVLLLAAEEPEQIQQSDEV